LLDDRPKLDAMRAELLEARGTLAGRVPSKAVSSVVLEYL